MRKPLIAGNWKMNKTMNEAKELALGIKAEVTDFSKVDVVLCPPFTDLFSVYEIINDTEIGLGVQNMYWEKVGAFTGEISPIMVKDSGAEYVILGHSERRQYFKETNEIVNRKVKAALEIGLLPILCIGETLEEREAEKTIEVVKTQLKESLQGIEVPDILQVIIAYEPIWAIGTGKTATPVQAQEVHAFIRSWLKDAFSDAVSQTLRVLYGGSVTPDNIKELITQPDIDGGLIGGASLKVSSFVNIVKKC